MYGQSKLQIADNHYQKVGCAAKNKHGAPFAVGHDDTLEHAAIFTHARSVQENKVNQRCVEECLNSPHIYDAQREPWVTQSENVEFDSKLSARIGWDRAGRSTS